MIEISNLTKEDKGRVVHFEDENVPEYLECGIIKSWNDHYIFVQYFVIFRGERLIKNCGETAAATDPHSLTFAFPWEAKK